MSLEGLAHPGRMELLVQLLAGERDVTSLTAALGWRQPNTSQQLMVLRRCGLVATRREKKSVYYRLRTPAVCALVYAACAVVREQEEEEE